MKWLWALLLWIVFCLAMTLPTKAEGLINFDPVLKEMTIFFSPGGNYFTFNEQFNNAASLGFLVRIDGPCASACTLALRNTHVCITPRARLGFHAAATEKAVGRGRRVLLIDSEFTKQVFYAQYPTWVQKWVDRTNALSTRKITWMEYGYARMFMETCSIPLLVP